MKMPAAKLKRLLGKDAWSKKDWCGNNYFWVKDASLPKNSFPIRKKSYVFMDSPFKAVPLDITFECHKGFKHLLYGAFTTRPVFFLVSERYKEFYTGEIEIDPLITAMSCKGGTVYTPAYRYQPDPLNQFWSMLKDKKNGLIVDYKPLGE